MSVPVAILVAVTNPAPATAATPPRSPVRCAELLRSMPTAASCAELIAQLDAKVVVPMPVCDDADVPEALAKFLHEMGVSTPPAPQSKLSLMPSSLPAELTTVLLEMRGKL